MIKRACVFAIIFLSVLSVPAVRAAQDLDVIFNKQTSYDIYLQSDENTLSVITQVNIIRLQEIGERIFLVVRPAEFTLNNTDGFVLLDAVQAILPNQKLKIRNTAKFNANW